VGFGGRQFECAKMVQYYTHENILSVYLFRLGADSELLTKQQYCKELMLQVNKQFGYFVCCCIGTTFPVMHFIILYLCI
jgi:hypothetical protein